MICLSSCQTRNYKLCEKCLNTEIFWSVFPRIWAEYGDLWNKSPYSVRIRENMDQKKLRIWTLFTQCKSKPVTDKRNRCGCGSNADIIPLVILDY